MSDLADQIKKQRKELEKLKKKEDKAFEHYQDTQDAVQQCEDNIRRLRDELTAACPMTSGKKFAGALVGQGYWIQCDVCKELHSVSREVFYAFPGETTYYKSGN